jgi:hypothetical protein
MSLACDWCGGTREIACVRCGGVGHFDKLRITTDGGLGTGIYRVDCPRCDGKGKRPCAACTDGLSESRLRDMIRRFGWFSRGVASFIDEGIEVALSKDGKSAEVSVYVRYAAHDQPVTETARWRLDERGWRVPEPQRPEAPSQPEPPRPPPAPAPRYERIAPPSDEPVASAF